jgi:hypothetical protein
VILPTDIPTRAEVDRLLEHRAPGSVSIYLPTDPASGGEAERIELKTLAGQAASELGEAGADTNAVRRFEEEIEYVYDDEDFWRYQARTLATFAAPDSLITFRLPNRLLARVDVSDRFHVRPLLRTLTFPQVAFVLVLAQRSVRLVEVTPDLAPATVDVDDLPSPGSPGLPTRRVKGSERQKARMPQYARQVDRALRPLLGGLEVPLILAAAEPLDSEYRLVNTYPHLLDGGIPGSSDTVADAELATRGRAILDGVYATQLRELQDLYGQRSGEGRAVADLAEIARAASAGAVETLFVDIDAEVPGSVEDRSGAVTFAPAASGEAHDVTDEVARRAWLSGARVLAVRDGEVPGDGPAAAILRYAV